jgi:hypothetical protein
MQTYLMNVLIFCGIILLLALTVAAVQAIIILIDVRRAAKEVKAKIFALTSLFDIVSLIMGGMDLAKGRIGRNFAKNGSTIIALVAGLKKGLQVLFNPKGGE